MHNITSVDALMLTFLSKFSYYFSTS